MKLLRVFLFGALAILLVALIAAGVALNSSFQTWAARRALAGQPDLQASIGHVSAGLHRIEVQDVRAESHGAVLTLPSLETELPLIAAGLDHKVTVHRLVAKGWKLDLTHAIPAIEPTPGAVLATTPAAIGQVVQSPVGSSHPSPSAQVRSAFQGIFSQLQLPVDVTIDGLELDGDVLLPTLHENSPTAVHVAIRGSGIGAGSQGSLTADLEGTDRSGGRMTVHAVVTPTMDTPQTFSRLAVTGEATATGAQFPKGVRLGVQASAERTSSGEAYRLVLDGEGKQLIVADATFARATGRIGGTWKLNLRHSDLAPFTMGQPLPTFMATGDGSFETDATFTEIHAVGRLDASADQLQTLRQELSAMGAVKLATDFDVLQHAGALRVERLSAEFAGAKPVASVRALQPFEFNFSTGELRVAEPAKDLLGVSLHGLPLAWAAPFLGDLLVRGGDVQGDFAASARDGGLTLSARTPLSISHLTVTRAGQPLIRDVDFSLQASADYTPQGWQAEVAELALSSAGKRLLAFSGKAGQLTGKGKTQPLKATGRWQADLPTLLAQPVAAGNAQLTNGTAEGDFTASVDGVRSLQLNAALKGLQAPDSRRLPAVSLEMRADVAASGKITFNLPLIVEQDGRKSDLTIAGTALPTKAGMTVEASVGSEQIVAEDMQLLLLPLGGGEPAKPAPAGARGAKPSGPDVKPFWSGIDGKLTLALKKLSYGSTFQITNVGGTLNLSPAALQLENVKAIFSADSDLKLAGAVKFTARTKEPYALTSDLAVTNFDAGAAFRAIDPAKLPTIEGKINVTSHLAGQGGDVEDLAAKTRGDFQLTGRSGIFRALSFDLGGIAQQTQSTLSMIGGVIDSVRGKKQLGDYADKSQVVVEVAKRISEIPFDQLSVTANRAENMDLVLKDFTVISPEVRLGGSGSITYVEGKSLLQQPLAINLNIAAQGQVGDLMKKAGLLDETKKDSLGYTAFLTPIKIGGTLENTDTSELRTAFAKAALEKTGLLNLFSK